MSDGRIVIDTDLDSSGVEKGVSKLGDVAKNGLKGLGTTIGAATAAVTGAIAAVGAFSMKGAMELEASEAKYNTVFGEFTSKSDAFIKEFQKLTPATTAEARNMASGLQDMLIPMGFARDTATDMTGQFMHAAGALTNFNSGTETTQSVIDKMTAALTGEMDGLKSLGVQLDSDTVKRKAVEMGLASSTKEVDKQAQAQVILSEIYAQSGDALAAYNEESLDAKTKFGLLKAEMMDTAAEIGSGFLPILNECFDSITNGFRDAIPQIKGVGEGLLGMIQGAEGASEQFKTNMGDLLDNTLNNILSMVPQFTEIAFQIIMTVIETIATNLPNILNAGIQMLLSLIDGLVQTLPNLIPVAIDSVLSFIETIIDNLDSVIDSGIELILALVDGIINALPRLIEKVPIIIDKLVTAVSNNLPKIINAGIDILIKLAQGLIMAIPQLVSKIPQIISSIVNGFKSQMSSFLNIGRNIVEGVWNGIVGMGSWISGKVSGFFSGIVDKAKSALGIHSPSRVFRDQVGKYMAQGVGVGFEEESDDVSKTMKNTYDGMINKMQASVSFGRSATPTSIINSNFNKYDSPDNIESLVKAVKDISSRPIQTSLEIAGETIVNTTAQFFDNSNGQRLTLTERGLML